jgi:hypothetical protein
MIATAMPRTGLEAGLVLQLVPEQAKELLRQWRGAAVMTQQSSAGHFIRTRKPGERGLRWLTPVALSLRPSWR